MSRYKPTLLPMFVLFMLTGMLSGCEKDPFAGAIEHSTSFNHHYYSIIDDTLDFEEAKKKCEANGGHLVTISSKEEQTFIQNLLSQSGKNMYWLGYYKDDNGNWQSVDQSAYTYTNYLPGQPDNNKTSSKAGENYLAIYAKNNANISEQEMIGYWNDLPKDASFGSHPFFGLGNIGYIIEWDYNIKLTTTINQCIQDHHYSRRQIIQHLIKLNFNEEEVIQYIDSKNLNWNQEAKEASIAFIKYGTYSPVQLQQKLLEEGYSQEQVTAGIKDANINWNQEAIESANIYKKYASHSKEYIIEQLVQEGFTLEQANQAVSETKQN